jgi:eukaryotic-like serine/threonine-protein kinase
MSMTPGTRIGPYEVTAPLGEGGMGVVYRARDTQLQRQVALKLLPDHFAEDSDRLNRFEREAQVLASLNHPNIAQIYGLEKSGNSSCIVMELVEGETLAERIKRGPFPLPEAIDIAKQMVDALEAAHERGIVHRDLKPANIKRTPAGAVKILDFGLAKATRNPLPSEKGYSNSPTMMSGSLAGVIMGTAPYMSPEQARGKEIDARTDIWAFGCVLYEMLTGRQVFAGETTTDVLAKVLEGQPKWDALPVDTPASIRTLLEATLTKDPKQRLQHVGDTRLFLARPSTIDKSSSVVIRDRGGRRGWIVAALLAVALLAAIIPAGLYFTRASAEIPVIRFEMPAPGFFPGGGPVISPDGQRIAYVAAAGGKPAIWIRPMGSLSAQQLPGTDSAIGLFWAPDSRRLAFFADGKLKKTDVVGGGVQTLGDAPTITTPGSWNRDGVILFGGNLGQGVGILRISDSGGAASLVAAMDVSSNPIQFFPRFLPDGQHFLFATVGPDGSTGNVYLGSLESKSATHVMGIPNFTADGVNSNAMYAQGYLIFSRDRTLLAQPFDPAHGTLSGEPSPIAENVGRDFSVSDTGVLVYRTTPGQTGQPVASLSWVDRKGKPVSEVRTPTNVGWISLSHDGRIAVDNSSSGNSDIWVIDSRGVPNKLTADNPNFDGNPVWSPDGSRIAFGSRRNTTALATLLFQKSSNGVGASEPLLPDEPDVFDAPLDWSTTGILYLRVKLATLQIADIWFLSNSDKKPAQYLHNGFANTQAQLSPDAKYIAYTTNESGTFQIVVQTFPDPTGGKWPITAQGGVEPMWRRDGHELYYLALDGKIMSVAVKTNPIFQAGETSELFQTTLTPLNNPASRRYAVSPDGQRILIASVPNATPTGGNSIPITAVVNWTATVKKK